MNISVNDKIDIALHEKKLSLISEIDKKIEYIYDMAEMNTRLAKSVNKDTYNEYMCATDYYNGYASGLERAKNIIENVIG